MNAFFRKFSPWIVLPCLVSILVWDFHQINTEFLGGDASQNLRSALNFLHHGIYSEAPLGTVFFRISTRACSKLFAELLFGCTCKVYTEL